jgi:hypothetical protein
MAFRRARAASASDFRFPHSPNDYGNNHGCNCQKDERLHFEGLPTFGEFPFFPAKSGLLAGAHYRAQAITTFTSI